MLGRGLLSGVQGEVGIEQGFARAAAGERGLPEFFDVACGGQGVRDLPDGLEGLIGLRTMKQRAPVRIHDVDSIIRPCPTRPELSPSPFASCFPASPGRRRPPRPSLRRACRKESPRCLRKARATFRSLLEAAEKLRGLKSKRPVPAGTLAEPELRRKMAESVAKDVSPEQVRAIEAGAKAFGLIPEDMSLGNYLPDLLATQVAGFYDPDLDYMALVRRVSDGPVPGQQKQEGDPEDVIIVHELTHALQDQYFDLKSFDNADPMSDAATARAALAEGDATLTMMSYVAGQNVETVPGMGEGLSRAFSDQALGSGMADLPGGEELSKAPAWIRDSLLFSYVQGFAFCLDVRRTGGQKLLDLAFASDPPRSSEQILHPEKWYGRRDDPVALAWPGLADVLPGWAKVSDGEVGEATIRTLLRGTSRNRASSDLAAAGWGGDRFAVYEKAGRRLLVWWTEWDTEADAREILKATRKLGNGWRVETLSPRRVLALRGDAALAREQRKALRGRLAAAEAVRPANRPIDLKALGAEPSPPRPASP